MKKILAIVMTVAMLLSMGVVLASARSATPGAYTIGSKDEFERVGDIEINWVPDAATKLNITDGKLDDWADYEPTAIGPENMVSWVGNGDKPANGGEGEIDPGMPEGWGLNVYFVADKDYLYVGFYITDPVVVPEAAPYDYGSGDAFQINIDFGRKLGEIVENDPEIAELMGNTQNIFYSFAYTSDGSINIVRQCSDVRDGQLNEEEHGVKGSTGKTDDGWCAEFRLPWQEMYDDYANKGWLDNIEDTRIYIGGVDNKPLEIGAGLYYLNKILNAEGKGELNWAAGTHSGITDLEINAAGCPLVSWDVYDNAMNLILKPQAGLEFTSPNIEVLLEDETEPPTVEETEAPTEPETEAPTAAETEAPTVAETEAVTNAGTTAGGTTAETKAPSKGGCSSVIGISAALVVAAAAAVVLKKKD